jgi:Domain of unknown function (DUF4349)
MAIIGGAVLGSAALAGCSGQASSSSAPESAAAAGAPQAAAPPASAAPAAAGAGAAAGDKNLSAAGSSGGGGQARSATTAKLAPATQQIIYTAQLTVRSKDVDSAVAGATRIVTAAGGYVSSENATSDPDHPANATATIELKIPVTVYQQTLASLSGGSLGTQLSLRQQAQDVTQQVADVDSQVTSDLAAIAQLRELLKHAGSVGELLDVQNQINQQEAALEGMQAQQRALNHETSFATLTLTVLGPKAVPKPAKPVPPPGLGKGLSGGWHAFKLTIDWLLAILGAIAPFVAVLAIVAYGGWRLRRRVARPAVPPAPQPEPPAGT